MPAPSLSAVERHKRLVAAYLGDVDVDNDDRPLDYPKPLKSQRSKLSLTEPFAPSPCIRLCGRQQRTSYGLCRKCYNGMTPAERRALPRRKHQETPDNWRTPDEAPQPSTPTAARPRSAVKVEEMASRARQRQQLFHPDDAGSRPVNHLAAFTEMCCRSDTRGVYKEKNAWRCRPWVGYLRFCCGSYRQRELAVEVFMLFKKLAPRLGPEKARLEAKAWGAVRKGDAT